MRLLFTAILLTLSASLFAQYQIRSAKLTDRNDKVQTGFVKYYDWNEQPKFIEFSRDSLGLMQQLFLKDIQKLVIKNGPLYESLYLDVPYYVKTPITQNESPIQRVDSTYYLAEILLDSESIKFYRFFDDDNRLRFVISKYDSLVVLEDKHTLIKKNDKVYDYEEPSFRNTLKTILSECPTLNTDNVTYTESSIINLLKQYFSFCRIDSQIYLEQKKLGKSILGVGAYGSFWGIAGENVLIYGVNLQILLNRRLHNLFILTDIGGISKKSYSVGETNLQLGLYAGRYFGYHAIQGKIYIGISTTLGPLDTGVGLSYRKMLSIDIRYPIFIGAIQGFRAYDTLISPLFNVMATLPLSRTSGQ